MTLQFNVSPKLLERVAVALERIADHLEHLAPIPEYKVPDEPFGSEAISYLDEEKLAEWEAEQKYQKEKGRPRS